MRSQLPHQEKFGAISNNLGKVAQQRLHDHKVIFYQIKTRILIYNKY